MSLRVLLASVIATASASALPASGHSTSVSTQQTCITRMHPGATSPASLATRTRTSASTVTTTETVKGQGQAKIETFSPNALTSTKLVNATSPTDAGEAAETPTVYVTVSPAAGNSSCTSTTTISADATSTVYTGSYNGSMAKRTASPMDVEKRSGPPLLNTVGHWFGAKGRTGRAAAMANIMKPFEVDCLEQATTYLIEQTTELEKEQTSTVTAEQEVVYVTSTRMLDATQAPSSVQAVTSTVTAAPSAGNSTGSGCTVSQGTAAATTTQHLKCAPTNLIGEIDGYGIGSTHGHANETQGLAPGSDPSACCQLCVDTEGCAASEDDQDAGNCFLWYTSNPTCGLGFTYSNGGEDLEPGTGFLVQSGCGYIESGEDPEGV
ncbi:hypothetical protein KC349_g3050 [Hortaea werneckii]|nr:hypothetical protein KC349_g3050 [Hortaea werneckii]